MYLTNLYDRLNFKIYINTDKWTTIIQTTNALGLNGFGSANHFKRLLYFSGHQSKTNVNKKIHTPTHSRTSLGIIRERSKFK